MRIFRLFQAVCPSRRYRPFFYLFLSFVVLLGIITYFSRRPQQGILIETPGGPYDYVMLHGLSQTGRALISTIHDQQGQCVFFWTKGEGLQRTGLNNKGGIYPGISKAGQIVFEPVMEDEGGMPAHGWFGLSDRQETRNLRGTENSPKDFNESGHIVGHLEGGSSRSASAFLWTKEHGIQHLGTLGGAHSWALALNERDHVIGIAQTKEEKEHAFLWTKEHGMQDLGTLGGDDSLAYAINEADQIIGVSDTKEGANHAFLWTRKYGMQDLGTLGGKNSWAYAINEIGQIVGYAETKTGQEHAFVWTQEHGMQPLYEHGGVYSVAQFINDAGQIIGIVEYEPSWWVEAWEWSSAKLNFPDQYRPDIRKYRHSRIAYWEVPPPLTEDTSKNSP